jgi:hypothetical protein
MPTISKLGRIESLKRKIVSQIIKQLIIIVRPGPQQDQKDLWCQHLLWNL